MSKLTKKVFGISVRRAPNLTLSLSLTFKILLKSSLDSPEIHVAHHGKSLNQYNNESRADYGCFDRHLAHIFRLHLFSKQVFL